MTAILKLEILRLMIEFLPFSDREIWCGNGAKPGTIWNSSSFQFVDQCVASTSAASLVRFKITGKKIPKHTVVSYGAVLYCNPVVTR